MRFQIFKARISFGTSFELSDGKRRKNHWDSSNFNPFSYFLFCSYRALVRFLASVSAHVDDQHVLRFKRLLLSGTFLPAADETLLVGVDVIVVDVFDQVVLSGEFFVAVAPVAVRLDKVARLVFHRIARSVVTVVIHRLHSVQVVVVRQLTVLGRLTSRRSHRFFLDFGPHFSHFHVSFAIHRAGNRMRGFLFGRFILFIQSINQSINHWFHI